MPAQPGTVTPQARLVVGLGASAGGLEALASFFSHMPPNSGMTFIVVQHLDRHHASMLSELLGRQTRMPVAEAQDGASPAPDHVYVISPNSKLTLERGCLRVATPDEPEPRMPVDALFHSLAEDQGERAVGIVLSGALGDGTSGLRAIKGHGGLTLAQSPDTAKQDSMPQIAIAAGVVDDVLPVEQMPARLLAHLGQLGSAPQAPDLDSKVVLELPSICSILHRATGHDFGGYKTGTLVRRISRRMFLQHVASPADYRLLLERDSEEPQRLLKELLIAVTQFFRDPEAFEKLERQVLPPLFEGKAADEPVRIWVPGCASGEEAYSIAILAREQLARLGSTRLVQIFATDVDLEFLAVARAGRYGPDLAAHVTSERLESFFLHDALGYQVVKDVREMCIFSAHNLTRDPPFSSLDLISCRNVLIYFDAELQKNLVPLFHYALRPGGFLFLGPSEGLAGSPELFETFEKRLRIFRRRETAARPAVAFPISSRRALSAPVRTPTLKPKPKEAQRDAREVLARSFERLLLDDFAPCAALINEQGEILFVEGRTAPYFQIKPGAISSNVFDLVQGPLRLELHDALPAAVQARRAVTRTGVRVDVEGTLHRVRLSVRPMHGDTGVYAVVVQQMGGIENPDGDHEPSALLTDRPVIDQLESELKTTRADLKQAVEDLEVANEDSESANEELQSANEELQSANEELQSANEELQSSREELETVNTELHLKVDELGVVNSDLANFFASTEVATLFLDRNLRVSKFTPAATKLFSLIESDIGRPLGDLAASFVGEDLVADAREVLRALSKIERQVRSLDGNRWYILRAQPYRTTEDVLAGVVVTFVDVSELKGAQEADRSKNQFLAMLSHELRNPLAPIRNSLHVLNRAAPGGEQARRAYAVIDRQVAHLTRLVDDLLDVTRFSRGKIELRRERLDLCGVVLRALEDSRGSFEENGVELQVTVPEVPLWIDGDQTRIAQAIANLLHNSAKFTDPGGKVTLSVEGNVSLRQAIVRIRDTGVGISSEMLPRVFEPFAQADRTLDRSKGGLGLGLALVKGLVEMHDGTVSVESEGVGKGAEFTVRLPLARVELPTAAPVHSAVAGAPRRVLVIEDNIDAAESLRDVLELREHTVEVAFSGTQGIEKARAFRPDVVLCDIGLPGIDGYEVAKAMRAESALKSVALVALTGYAGPADLARATAAGFEHHMAKPPSMEKLELILASLPPQTPGPSAQDPSDRERAP